MNADEIVRALREAYKETDKVYFFLRTLLKDAADLIESQQSQLTASQRREKEAEDCIRREIEKAPTVPAEVVVHCENCQHIHILNTSEIYAICDKTNFIFQPFGVDTREFGCPYGERRESEGSK